MSQQPRSTYELVREYYGEVLKKSEDLATNACCATGAPPALISEALQNIHPKVSERFYGCGFPIPDAIDGATVLDLGCGTGRDCYVISQLAGPKGFVHGVDMTAEQLAVAEETLGWHMERFGFAQPNTAFHQGYIEDLASLGIEDSSVDVVVSNCVVNLSPRKDLVLDGIHRVLKPGGEFYFSDVFADRRLAPEVASDPLLYAECLGGAMYDFDFMTLARRSGFGDPRTIDQAGIAINTDAIRDRVGAASFTSVTMRLFKLDGLDERCEDYGQIATYRGGVPGAQTVFKLDNHHLFEAGRPERVCGNTAAMLRDTRLGRYFDVAGDTSVHYGEYPCDPTLAARLYGERGTSESGDSGACC